MMAKKKEKQPLSIDVRSSREDKARLDLLYEVGKKISAASQMSELLERIIVMTQRTLRAAASSVLVIDENEAVLSFEAASGPSGQALQQVSVDTKSGIAGWVARHGEPLIVNDVRHDRRFNRAVDKTTGFVTKAIICVPMIAQGRIVGVIEVLNKLDGSDFSDQDLDTLMSVAATSAVSIENARLQNTLVDAYKSTIRSLAAAIDAKDPYTQGHSHRVMQYALLAARAMPLPEDDVEVLEYAGALHDIGKIAIPDSILNKPASLTPEEWKVMREHPAKGAKIMAEVPFLERASQLVLHHHERYDGQGYPGGLKGDAIPLGARLMAVADAFDTMTTDRAYRAALSLDYAIGELHGCAGKQFCPVSVKAFISGLRKKARSLPGQPARQLEQALSGRLAADSGIVDVTHLLQ